MNNLITNLNGLILKNPVTVASGTFGCGREYSEFYDIGILGAVSVKGITLKERKGNPAPRLIETEMGLINSVGLQNPGVMYFIENEIPFLRKFDTKIIANINGATLEEYIELASILDSEDIDSIEVNISCPNVKEGGMAFGSNPEMARKVVEGVREKTSKHLIVKLSPNVTDIGAIAKACEDAGANALSLVNTFAAMKIDIKNRKPILHLESGGLSGPAIKPLALKKVFDAYRSVSIPIIGMGGIETGENAAEFLMAGASAIAVGTSNFTDPFAAPRILKELKEILGNENICSIIGAANKRMSR